MVIVQSIQSKFEFVKVSEIQWIFTELSLIQI